MARRLLLIGVLSVALVAPSVAQSDDNAHLVRRWFEVLETGNLAIADEVIAPNFITHDSSMPEAKGPEGMKQRARLLRTAFPDIKYTLEHFVVEGDKVATHWTFRGTQQGPFRDIAPTGKAVTVTGTVIFRVANGKLEESWVNWDALGML